MGLRRALAWAWLAAFAAACGWLALRLPSAGLETSVLAWAPWSAPDPAVQAATKAVQERVGKSALILCGAPDPAAAGRAADACAAALRRADGLGSVACAVPPGAGNALLDFYGPRATLLLSAGDRADLASGGDGLLRSAEAGLAFPGGLDAGLGFERDPFGVFGRWLSGAAALSGGLGLEDGHLLARGEGLCWAAVSVRVDDGGAEALARAWPAAAAAARAAGARALLRSGFAFHEAGAAAQAKRESGRVGALSTALLALLLALAFRRPRPMLLALLPAAVGCAAGAAAVLLLWTKVQAVALVFGSTVVGVADDYGLYFLSGLYDGPWDPQRRGRACLAPLALAMGTSVAGYAVLGILPIPALRQVAVFACVGLAADWAGVVLWYPALTKGLEPVPERRKERAARLRRAWPRWDSPWGLALLALVLLGGAAGCLRLRCDDDPRLLYAHDAALEGEEARVQALTGQGGAAGFFVVQAPTAQGVLEREESLRAALAAAGAPDWIAVSAFVPSLKRQAQDRAALGKALFSRGGLAGRFGRLLGSPGWAARLRGRWRRPVPPLDPAAWLSAPVSAPWRGLWLPGAGPGFVSVVLPGPGLARRDLERLAPLGAACPGVEYADPLRSAADLLGGLRRLLVRVLAWGSLLVLGVLALRLGRGAVGAFVPSLLGAVAGLGALGWSGQALNLFALLALLLLLGTAVDFGIYLRDSGGRLSSFVAVQAAALVNLAAVGVLAFSATPALRGFGLVLGAGCLVAWLAAPCFRARESA